MAIPSAVVSAVASQIPWKDVIAAAPDVWKSARDLFASSARKAQAPAVDPADDIRVQLAALASRSHDSELAQAEQAKLIAAMAGQMQAMTTQMQVNATRAKRVMWAAFAACGLSAASLAFALLR